MNRYYCDNLRPTGDLPSFLLTRRGAPISTLFPCTSMGRSEGSIFPLSALRGGQGGDEHGRVLRTQLGQPWASGPEQHTPHHQSRGRFVCRLLLVEKGSPRSSLFPPRLSLVGAWRVGLSQCT